MVAPFVYAWPGNPKRLKALQTESERHIVELVAFRQAFPAFRDESQDVLNQLIDIWLTVNGYDNRLNVPEAG